MSDDTHQKRIHIDLPQKSLVGQVQILRLGSRGIETAWVTVEDAIALLRARETAIWLVTDTPKPGPDDPQ